MSRNADVSERHRQILEHLVAGATNAEIARALGISSQTVKNHLTRLMDKTGSHSRTELAVHAIRRGWVQIEIEAQP